MYLLFGLFFGLCLLFFLLFHVRKRCVIRKVCCMDYCRKTAALNELLEPFGFSWLSAQDVISSEIHAWQRAYGYHALFDRSAVRFNMVFDCEPIYFDYNGRTWLIEFWKGQYGINIGAEVGIYCTDAPVKPEDYRKTLFSSVSDEEMLPISIVLYRSADPDALSEICCGNCTCCLGEQASVPAPLFWISRRHWWLTGFRMGQYSEPSELILRAAITFPDVCMQQSFVQGLLRAGYTECDIKTCGHTVSFLFAVPHTAQPREKRPLATRWARCKNRCFCCLYQSVTKPFTATCDKLLYLYYFLPPVFLHMLKFQKNRKQKCRRTQKSS